MTRRRLSGACLIVLAALVLAPAGLATPGKPLPALVEAPRDALTRALERGRISEATYALERAISLFDRRSVAARYGSIARPDGREATLVLRDLAIRLDRLRGTERKRGEALLARPTLGASDPFGNGYTTSEATPVCGDFVCIHYVATTPDASTSTFAGQALQVFDDAVWPTQVTTMGYRAPKSDITSSPQNGTSSADPDGSQFDVYLTNLGDDGIYGYCTTDDPNAPVAGSFSYPHYDMSAYCVLDNGYTEFVASTGNTALENLQVTAAHEFQHAVQFAYDALEDPWVMEATATWIEDELFDAVDDNLQYLPDGPLGKPAIPLDKFTPTCCHVYGDWIFFRFLSEQFGAGTASDPTIVRRVWERADGSAAGPDDHSIQAVKNVLAARGSAFTNVFAMFGWVNRVSRSWYEEGHANSYPQAPLSASAMTLKPGSPSRSKSVKTAHQTQRYYQFKRGAGVRAAAKLRVTLDLPNKTTGSAATALVYSTSNVITPTRLLINSKGNGTFSLPFGKKIASVELVLTNASTRYRCWTGYQSASYACAGTPLDDGRVYKFTAKLR